jgi:hypothetical protein
VNGNAGLVQALAQAIAAVGAALRVTRAVSEQAAVKRVETEIRRRRNAAFGGIAGTGTEKVCQRTTSGGFRWRPVTSAM